ncbi:MAG: TauD/TfdA family dioxygenase [Prochloraceae cyanobacterium]
MTLTSQIEIKPLSEAFGKIIINADRTGLLDLDRKLIIDSFQAEGVLLFKGFAGGADSFIEFSNSISQDFMDYTGGYVKRDKINNNPTVLTVNDFNNEIKLHGEMYYQKQHPSLIWFYCAQPPEKDGQTIVCDGKQFYNELSDSLKNLFATKKLKFPAKLSKETWQRRYKTEDIETLKQIAADNDLKIEINEDLSITKIYQCSAFNQSQDGKERIFINSLLAAKYFNPNLVCFEDGSEITEEIVSELNEIAERIIVEINWQKGDILMVDNERVMHGRRAFSDEKRDIYIRLCAPAF